MSRAAAPATRLQFPGDLLSIADLSADQVHSVFHVAAAVKSRPADFRRALDGKSLVLLFEKPSLRTRVTFDLGIHQLGGYAVYLDHQKVLLGERESLLDVARNLERWCDAVVARTYRNRTVVELARHASIPVVNGLTDLLHPCQGLTDLFTLTEHFGDLTGRKLAYIGDGNNTCHSLIYGCVKLGLELVVITPEGYEPNSRVVSQALAIAQETGATLTIDNELEQVAGAHVVTTDTWTSMGQESENEERHAIFHPYQVNDEVMALAAEDAVFMHCLPAHRGSEVTAEVIDSDRSLVYDTAENRLHVQKALLLLLLNGDAVAPISGGPSW